MSERISVQLSRKVSDGDYGSYEATIGLEDDLPAGSDRSSFAAALRAWCKAFLDESIAMQKAGYGKPAIAVALPARPETIPMAPTRADEPEHLPIDPYGDEDNEYDIFVVDRIRIQATSTGTKVAKAFGGKWTTFGVMVWPEVLEALIGDFAELDLGQEFKPPKVGTRAKALLNAKGNPSKVVEWLA